MLAALLNVTGWMVLMGLALWLPAASGADRLHHAGVGLAAGRPVLGERPTVLRTVALVMALQAWPPSWAATASARHASCRAW
jgi:hypothetical protein